MSVPLSTNLIIRVQVVLKGNSPDGGESRDLILVQGDAVGD